MKYSYLIILILFLGIIPQVHFAQEVPQAKEAEVHSPYLSPDENARENFKKIVQEFIEKKRKTKLGIQYRPIDWDNTGQSPDERVDEHYRKLLRKLLKAFDEAHMVPALKTFIITLPQESIPPR